MLGKRILAMDKRTDWRQEKIRHERKNGKRVREKKRKLTNRPKGKKNQCQTDRRKGHR